MASVLASGFKVIGAGVTGPRNPTLDRVLVAALSPDPALWSQKDDVSTAFDCTLSLAVFETILPP